MASAPGVGVLLDDLGDLAGANGTATLTDGEPQALVHSDRLDQLNRDRGVVTRHHHLGALRQRHDTRHVRGPEVELRTVVVEERRVAATLVLREDVGLALELRVRGDRARLDDNLAALDVLALDTTEQQTDVLTGSAGVQHLVEHLDAGDGGLAGLGGYRRSRPLRSAGSTALDPAGDDRTATGDGEDVSIGIRNGLADLTHRVRHVLVDSVHELHDAVGPLLVALKRLEAETRMTERRRRGTPAS